MPDVKPGHRWPIYPVRALCVLLLLQVLGQAALAGGFISGNVGLLSVHTINGLLIVLTATALLPAAVLLVRPGRGPWWPIIYTTGLCTSIIMQVGVGFARELGLHIPLGVAVFGLVAALTYWSFAYRPKWAAA